MTCFRLRSSTGPVAQWIRHRPTEPGIVGSSPTGVMHSLSTQSSSSPLLHKFKVQLWMCPGTSAVWVCKRQWPMSKNTRSVHKWSPATAHHGGDLPARSFCPPRCVTSASEILRNASSGPVAQWIRHRPREPGIVGSSPSGVMQSL